MTLREKILNYLSILDINPTGNITLMDLKQKYLYFAKLYSPEVEEYKDGKKYYEMKMAYDYLYDHIDLVNEEIKKINSGIPDIEKEVKQEPKVEVIDEAPKQSQERINPFPTGDLKVQDRPSVFGILMSILSPLVGFILFGLLRGVAPKSSIVYLIIAIVGLVINILITVFLFPMVI